MLPALFVSHGSPTLPLDDVPARAFLQTLAKDLPRPEFILAVSAHWETATPSLTAGGVNDTIHDFYGFPENLYRLRYPAPGAPERVKDIAGYLQQKGFATSSDSHRGLDHGAWIPLMLMYPKADIPVLQLSIQPQESPAHHIALGEALRPLREKCLILASGGYVHNLRALNWRGGPEPDWSKQFSKTMDDAIMNRRTQVLVDYRNKIPNAAQAHPSEDHILPLFVAYGAGDRATHLHESATFGSLRMDAYRFD